MKKILFRSLCLITVLLLTLGFTSCSKSKKIEEYAEKGYIAFLEYSEGAGVTAEDYHNLFKDKYTFYYVYLEEYDTVYYKAVFNASSRVDSMYFMYLVDEDYYTESGDCETAYEYAYSLYMEDSKTNKGGAGILNVNKMAL